MCGDCENGGNKKVAKMAGREGGENCGKMWWREDSTQCVPAESKHQATLLGPTCNLVRYLHQSSIVFEGVSLLLVLCRKETREYWICISPLVAVEDVPVACASRADGSVPCMQALR